MKPAFAISFTDDGLALLHRERRGWAEIGQTGFDTPDLGQAMDWLRSLALGLMPEGVTTALVIPPSQILYTDVTVRGAGDATRRAQIAAALEGRTPYDVADLVFDYVMVGDVAQVAVVARETLDEAEGFAATYGLNPVAFTTVAPEGRFASVPFFGMTSIAPTILPPGQTIKRETKPVLALPRILHDQTVAPDDTTAVAQIELPLAVDAQTDVAMPVGLAQDGPESALPEPVLAEPVLAELTVPADWMAEPDADASAPDDAPLPTSPEPQSAPSFAAVYAEELAASDSTAPSDPSPVDEVPIDEVPVDAAPVTADAMDVLAFDPIPVPPTPQPELPPATSVLTAPDDFGDEAPIALDVPDDPDLAGAQIIGGDGLSVTASTTADPDDADMGSVAPTPVPAAVAASLAFASRRTVEASVISTARPNPPRIERPTATASRPVGAAMRPATDADPERPADRPMPSLGGATGAKPLPPKTARDEPKRAKVTIPSIQIRRNVLPTAAEKLAKAATDSAAAAAAKPSEFKPKGRPPVGGKPRFLGLILTGLLLLFLAVAAALSSFYLAGLGSDAPDTENAVTETAPPESGAADPVATETAATETATPAPTASVTAPVETAAAPPATPDAAPAVGVSTAAAAVAVDPSRQDEIILSSADQAPAASDAGALPVPNAQGDPPPAAVAAPPPFGTVYQFDANGLIVPTPEGILTPEGVLLIAGRPPREPPARPADLVPPDLVPATPAIPDSTTPDPAAQGSLFPADPALADARPRARPADLAADLAPTVPADLATTDDAPSLAPPSLAPPVGQRPAARPASVLAAGQQALQDQLAAASLAAPAAADPNRSVLAIAVSRRPAPRPADMARAVEAAVAAAARQPDPAPEPAQDPPPEAVAEAAAPEADAEPEDQGSMPRLPTQASVAKQATVANVLNLSKINLIGVYGSSSDRSALVRQANGRYVKVAVGDRLDGGRVSAITDSEVRYEKGGRMVVLTMPRG